MRNKLKQFRIGVGMTQAETAEAVGVSQPNYQRWETGAAPIPEDKLNRLAKSLKTTPAAILGKHPPIRAGFYDDSVGEDLNYYGEVAIHYCGGGAPLLLSISEGAFHRLYEQLQQDATFVTVESLVNQTVAIRTKAIADLYFSSEAYDDCGPERDYPDHIDIQMPDPRDWEIVEALECSDADEFDSVDVERVTKMIMTTDEQYAELVSSGRIKPEELESVRERNQRKTDRIFELATHTTYQLSTGQRRRVYVDGPETLFDAFHELTDFQGGDPADNMILLAAEGWHRTVFINKGALDYVMIPTHQYLEGRTEAASRRLDSPKRAANQGKKKGS